MKIKTISESEYEEFVSNHSLASFYQSIEWYHEKIKEGKTCELIGLFLNDLLIGVSLVIYLPVLKKYKFAYLSRGFIYDYKDIVSFKEALEEYFKDVLFVKLDPPIILAKYNSKLEKETFTDSLNLINTLKENGFQHFGFNMANEAFQFRFIHRLPVEKSWEDQLALMSKSTRKNIEIAHNKGVMFREAKASELDEVIRLFNLTMERKNVKGFSKSFYENILNTFSSSVNMYIIYIDKKIYQHNLEEKLNEAKENLQNVENKMQHDHVGLKLTKAHEQAISAIKKCEEEQKMADALADITNIASMLTITKYKEVVSLTSGMDNNYREYCPKYVMYPAMIKKAIAENLSFVNFLGVKNIFDEHDKDHGVYEVKRGFGGETIEYIGEFDLPIKKGLYKLYKIKNKIKK